MSTGPIRTLGGSTLSEREAKIDMAHRLRQSPLPETEILDNACLYLPRQTLARLFFIQHIYKQILNVHGSIFEFGVRWGQNMALFSNLRATYEPYNYNRQVIGFDTFEGFPNVTPEDGGAVQDGDYGVTEGWETDLTAILEFHERNAPIPHKRKFELVKGNASTGIHDYLAQRPETIIALAYFDFDIYQPTRDCLEAILPHLTKGSVLAFDELNLREFPGETIALREVIGLSKYGLQRIPESPLTSYLVID